MVSSSVPTTFVVINTVAWPGHGTNMRGTRNKTSRGSREVCATMIMSAKNVRGAGRLDATTKHQRYCTMTVPGSEDSELHRGEPGQPSLASASNDKDFPFIPPVSVSFSI